MSELPLAQQAALLCDRPAFSLFANERYSSSDPVTFIRNYCGVSSRSEIRPLTTAAEKFYELQAEFDVWMRAA
jgi:hypothetical protein